LFKQCREGCSQFEAKCLPGQCADMPQHPDICSQPCSCYRPAVLCQEMRLPSEANFRGSSIPFPANSSQPCSGHCSTDTAMCPIQHIPSLQEFPEWLLAQCLSTVSYQSHCYTLFSMGRPQVYEYMYIKTRVHSLCFASLFYPNRNNRTWHGGTGPKTSHC